MADRRRARRFVLPERVHGSLRIMEDVYVERIAAGEVTVLIARPPALNEELLLELAPHGGRRRALSVQALRGGPIAPGDTSRYRATLVPSANRSYTSELSLNGWRTDAPGSIGVLVRRIPTSVSEVSARGCLIESRHLLPEGTVGVLEVTMAEEATAEQLRICRMVRIVGGAHHYAAGAEFLPLGPPTPASVRNLIARLEMVLEIDSARSVDFTEDGGEPDVKETGGTDGAGPL
jgi:hypothetical protein